MNIRVIPVGPFATNCVVLWDDNAKAIVVDPGSDADTIDEILSRQNLTVSEYWLTHGHLDHISGLEQLLEKRPAPVKMHSADATWAFTAINTIEMYPPPPSIVPNSLQTIAHNDVLPVGQMSAKVVHTPGHTPGCLCFYFEKDKLLLSGDTLFHCSIGRTDLPGGDWNVMVESLKVFSTFPSQTRVIPGHGNETEIGRELLENPFLQKD